LIVGAKAVGAVVGWLGDCQHGDIGVRQHCLDDAALQLAQQLGAAMRAEHDHARHSFRVNAYEVQDVIESAASMLEQMNDPGTEGLAISTASPSATACGWCPFRPACGPFFDAYDETWQIPHALLFGIDAVDQSTHGYSVRATVARPRWRENEEVHVLGFPFGRVPATGDLWGATNFAGRVSSAVALWNTTVFRWG